MSFPRSCVDSVGNLVALALAQLLHRRAFWPVLPQQAIGVLVAAPLPRVVRPGEVDLDARRRLDLSISVKLGAVVQRQRHHR